MIPGEIYLGTFPFGDVAVMKLRPLLLLSEPVGPGPEIVTAYISSIIPAVLLPTDIVMDPTTEEQATTRLKTTSVVRLHKIATIHTTSLQRYIGAISSTTQEAVDTMLRSLLNL